MTKTTSRKLLRPDALIGAALGISVSDSADLSRLGCLEAHFRLALGELARTVLVSGGKLVYGGHLDPDGYTSFLVHELQRFTRRDSPFTSVLAWQEHRRRSVSDLRRYEQSLGLLGNVCALNPQGIQIDPGTARTEEPLPENNPTVVAQSLTAMRRYMTSITNGRIFLGGKRHGFQGDMPGLLEEALYAIDAKQPVYLAGGFGGATLDLAIHLGVCPQLMPSLSGATLADQRTITALEKIKAIFDTTHGESIHNNGLNSEENRRLALSHRPSEIAALVALGLGRRVSSV